MWGIPEKNYQKLAQQCKLDHSNVLPAHEMTRSPFAGFSPIVIPIENFKWDGQYRLWVYKFETLRNALYCQDKKSLQRTCPKSKFFFWHRLVTSVPSRRIIYLLQCIVDTWWPGVMAHDNLRGGRKTREVAHREREGGE